MSVLRNNSVGALEVSSASVAKQYRTNTANDGDTLETDPLYVQGMKNIAIQAQEYTTNVNIVTITLYGAIAQEGALPDFFPVKEYSLATGAGTNIIFDSLVLPVQFIKVIAFIGVGTPDVIYRVRLMASQ